MPSKRVLASLSSSSSFSVVVSFLASTPIVLSHPPSAGDHLASSHHVSERGGRPAGGRVGLGGRSELLNSVGRYGRRNGRSKPRCFTAAIQAPP